jgi:hypothetical protein
MDMQVMGLRSNAGYAFECTGYFAVERTPYGRPQITARAGRVRRGLTGLRSTLAMRATVSAFERTKCGRTHFGRAPLLSLGFKSIFAPLVKM